MCSCLQCPQLSELAHFLLWELSVYIFHRQSLPSYCVDLICSLFSWWEGFGSSSLATLPLGFNYNFISTSAFKSSTGFCSWGCCGRLRSAPVRTRCGGGAAAWITGALASPGTQGSWQLGKQEIWYPRRGWQPIPVFFPGEFHGQRNLAGHSLQGCKESDMNNQSNLTCMDAGLFLVPGSSVPMGIMHAGGVVAWIMGTLAMLATQACWHYCQRRYGAIRAFSSLWQLCPSEDWTWTWCS